MLLLGVSALEKCCFERAEESFDGSFPKIPMGFSPTEMPACPPEPRKETSTAIIVMK
jgi:hypothetical protein